MAGSNDILLDIPLKETKVAMETIGAMLAPWNKTVYIGIPPVTKEESALLAGNAFRMLRAITKNCACMEPGSLRGLVRRALGLLIFESLRYRHWKCI